MGIVDGFQFFDGLSSNYIVVEENRIEDYVKYINKNIIKYVAIGSALGYHRHDIDFLNKCPDIEYLHIEGFLIQDPSPIYNLKHLKSLYLNIEKIKVDLSRTPYLEELNTFYYKNILNLDKCKNLKTLGITSYNPINKNLYEISHLENLSDLWIIRSNINSFKGIGSLNQLRKIDLTYLSNLYCLDELEKLSDNLSTLRFESCKKIQNHEYVANLKNLKLLSFDRCGDIPSVGFIKQMPNLKAFIFVGTNVIDGDLSPCIGLEYVAFDDKRHFSHKFKDFEKSNVKVGQGSLIREDF